MFSKLVGVDLSVLYYERHHPFGSFAAGSCLHRDCICHYVAHNILVILPNLPYRDLSRPRVESGEKHPFARVLRQLLQLADFPLINQTIRILSENVVALLELDITHSPTGRYLHCVTYCERVGVHPYAVIALAVCV